MVCGLTPDPNFPTLNAFQSTLGGGSDYDGFLMKFNPDNSLIALSMGPDGTVAVFGETISSNLPTVGPYQSSSAGNYDVIALRRRPRSAAPRSPRSCPSPTPTAWTFSPGAP